MVIIAQMMRASLCAAAVMPSALPSRPFMRRVYSPIRFVSGAGPETGRHAQGVGHAVGDLARFGFEHAAAADPVVRAQAQPGGEGFPRCGRRV